MARKKALRINMAFTDENYDFIETLARVRGQTLTDFVNDLIAKARRENADLYNKALEFRNAITSEMEQEQEGKSKE